MGYIVIFILAAYVVLLIVGGKQLTRKKWYKDLVVYIVLLTWSTAIAVGMAMDWPAVSAGTTVALINKSMGPLRNMMHAMLGWGME
jgi:hypothetical protein